MTSPRRVANQRLATAAASPTAPAPAPTPIISPQVRYNCHGVVMKQDARLPASSTSIASRIVRFRPMVSTSPVRNGPVRPISRMFSDTAPEMVPTLQPNARCNGTIITPGADRTPTTASIMVKVTASATQA